MKKLIVFIFAVVLLSSCVSNMESADRTWIVDSVKARSIRNSKEAIYTIMSVDSEGYHHNGFKFMDIQGKFQVGDTVKVVKR